MSNHHFNEPKYEYGWPSIKEVPGNTVHRPTEHAESENTNPQTSHSFIWQTFLETHHKSGTILGARDTGVTIPGQKPCLHRLTFWWEKLIDLEENTEYWKPRMKPFNIGEYTDLFMGHKLTKY